MNMPEYNRTKVTQLRFVDFRIVLNCKVRSLYMQEY